MRILNFKRSVGRFVWGMYIDYCVEFRNKNKSKMVFYSRNKGTNYKTTKREYSLSIGEM